MTLLSPYMSYMHSREFIFQGAVKGGKCWVTDAEYAGEMKYLSFFGIADINNE